MDGASEGRGTAFRTCHFQPAALTPPGRWCTQLSLSLSFAPGQRHRTHKEHRQAGKIFFSLPLSRSLLIISSFLALHRSSVHHHAPAAQRNAAGLGGVRLA